ncbi:RES family NAD+ phosphorylase [Klebsiella michiganensis]|uniref:RES family NAD+ phosphorylase n=1 Tax=Klebsiella michiganensis TaxID=1134687 RepID=UPI00292E8040|nr:RES family NAD+ phosphorylase [Klebsiella michiganensis]
MCSDEAEETWICASCIGESFLSTRIENEGLNEVCTYCGEKSPCFTLEGISDVTETAIEQHFIRTPVDPDPMEYAMIKHGEHSWYRHGYEIDTLIEDLLQTRTAVASAVQQCLESRHYDFDSAIMGEETEFYSGSHYEERQKVDTSHLDGMWAKFVSSLKTESRFINHSVRETLDGIFSGVENMHAGREKEVIIKAGSGTAIPILYRARWCRNHDDLENMLVNPDRELGPPPHNFSGANRMSARGISVFYGASSVATAIPEIRPPAGCNVVCAGFRIIRPLRLLNLPALENVWEGGSYFDPDFINKRAQVAFLRKLSGLMTDPVLPGEEEFRYIPTQVIAEYLADSSQLALDGILYPSVQNPNLSPSENYNVVLFHKASRVRYLTMPALTDCRISYGHMYAKDDWEEDICVTQIAEMEESTPEKNGYDVANRPFDDRKPALEIELATVSVHHIRGVTLDYSSAEVSRRKHIVEELASRSNIPATPPWDEGWPDDIPY